MSTYCVQSGNDDPRRREGDESLNTVECLRGRLLAERQASRMAKHQAHSMANKLVELENKLKDEIKLRERAERKLQRLKNKLESLNISSVSEGSEQSYSSEKYETPCTSASTDSHGTESGTKPDTTDPSLSQNGMNNFSETHESIAKHYDSHNSYSRSSSSQHPNPQDLMNNESSSSSISSSKYSNFQDLKNDESRHSSLSSKSSVTEYEEDEDHGDIIDNSLAIVPVSFASATTTTETRNVESVNESVVKTLEALRHARAKLVWSMGARQMIQVGHT